MFAELALACFLQVDGSASRSWKLLRLEYHQTKLADLAKFCMSIFKDFATIFFFGKKNCQQTKCRAKISPILVFKFENSCAIMQRKSVWSLYNRKNAKNNQNSYFPKMIKSNLKTFKKVKESSNKNPKQKRPNTFLLAKWERIIKKKTVKYHKYIKNIFFFFLQKIWQIRVWPLLGIASTAVSHPSFGSATGNPLSRSLTWSMFPGRPREYTICKKNRQNYGSARFFRQNWNLCEMVGLE